jgi:hypothetical protein
MRYTFKAALLAALTLSSAIALAQTTGPGAGTQVPTPGVAAPGQVVTTLPGRLYTYSATITGLAPAASATDLVTLSGSATKVVRVLRHDCVGTSTAAGSVVLNSIMRSTADTAGTSTSPAAVPYDSNNVAATGVVKAYTANPTLGTAIGTPLRTISFNTAPASAAGSTAASVRYDDIVTAQVPTLRGVAQSLALNAAGVTLPSGAALTCSFVWTEQ